MPADTCTPMPAATRQRLSPADAEAFGAALDAIRDRERASLGAADLTYIRRLVRIQRGMEIAGRVILFFGFFPIAWLLGVALLSLSKILDNMEIGHNVMHGQYDWSRDPALNSRTFEWDNVCPAGLWKHSHNQIHHKHTNILGEDRDVGYGLLRMADEQPWQPKHLLQPVRALIMALTFQWGVAAHDLELDRIAAGERSWRDARDQWRALLRKSGRQVLKDYVLFPLLAGPFFLPVLLGNLCANVVRNIWAFVIIFCGHFTADVEVFSAEECRHETRGQWYVRQLLGSANIEGGPLFHILSGNLSHQIEHHLFPALPAWRYARLAPEVRALCRQYGLPYDTGRLGPQFAQVVHRILRLSLPPRRMGNPAAA